MERFWMLLPLAGAGLACLVLLLPPRKAARAGPPRVSLWTPGQACILLLLFTALVLASGQVDPGGEWAPLRVALDFGGTAGLLVAALLPARRDTAQGWRRAGFRRLPLAALPWLVVLVGSVVVFRLVLRSYAPAPGPGLDAGEHGWMRVAATAGFMVLLAPVTEEVLYRGMALPMMAARVGGWAAVGLMAAAWSMAHGEIPLLPFFVLGVALGWLTLATGSLWASIGFHAAWNGAAVGYEIYDQVVGIQDPGPVSAPVVFLAVVGLLLGWARLLDTARAGGAGDGVRRPAAGSDGVADAGGGR